MPIRKAMRSDVRAMAETAAAAFMDEELFGELMHPYRKEYPEDFVRYWEGKFASHWHDPKHHFLVGLDGKTGKVVAVADWDRQGLSGAASTWSDYLDLSQYLRSLVLICKVYWISLSIRCNPFLLLSYLSLPPRISM